MQENPKADDEPDMDLEQKQMEKLEEDDEA